MNKKQNEQGLQDLWDQNKGSNIPWISPVESQKEGERGKAEETLKGIIGENVPNLLKHRKPTQSERWENPEQEKTKEKKNQC